MNNQSGLNNNLPTLEELQKNGIKMLVVIVNRADGDKATKFLREQHFYFQFTCMAEGTQGSDILDMLGLGSVDKTIIFCISSGFRINAALPRVEEGLKLRRAGKGIAFTVPLLGVSLPELAIKSERISLISQLLEKLESEVDKVNNSTTHSIILALVDQGNSEELVEAAKAAGAKGGTVVNARRIGGDEVVKFFGLTVQEEKEIVAILTPRENKQVIMDTINESFGVNSSARGIILSVPVDGVVGIET